MIKSRKKKFEVYEHLEHYVKKTTYAQRLQWLEDANNFVRSIQKAVSRKKKS
jgi:hypothetical protein